MNERFVLSKIMLNCSCNKCYKKWYKLFEWSGMRIKRYGLSQNILYKDQEISVRL
jgi:hypothetical protein